MINLKKQDVWIGITDFFYKALDNNNFRLCERYNLCCSDSALAIIVWKQSQTIDKWMTMTGFQ